MARPPPTDRPNSEGWNTKAKVPGSWKAAACIIGMRSRTRSGSTEVPPMKARPLKATRMKRSNLGGSPGADSGPVSLAQLGRVRSAICSVSSLTVFKL